MKKFDAPKITQYAGTDLAKGIRVKRSGGKVVAAGAGEKGIGVTLDIALADEAVAIELFTSPGSMHIVANEAITLDAEVYAGADGKVSDSSPAIAASGITGVEGSNNGLTFTAKSTGLDGNENYVELVDPAGNDQVLSVKIKGQITTVNLATGAGGAITSTGADVLAAVNAAAKCKVTATHTGASTGAAVVATASVNLDGGVEEKSAPKVGVAISAADADGELIEVINY